MLAINYGEHHGTLPWGALFWLDFPLMCSNHLTLYWYGTLYAGCFMQYLHLRVKACVQPMGRFWKTRCLVPSWTPTPATGPGTVCPVSNHPLMDSTLSHLIPTTTLWVAIIALNLQVKEQALIAYMTYPRSRVSSDAARMEAPAWWTAARWHGPTGRLSKSEGR